MCPLGEPFGIVALGLWPWPHRCRNSATHGFPPLRLPPTIFFLAKDTRPGPQYNQKPPVGLCHPLSPSAPLPPPGRNPHIRVTSHDRPDSRMVLAQEPSGRTPQLLPHFSTTQAHLLSPLEMVIFLWTTIPHIGTFVAIAAGQPGLYGGLPASATLPTTPWTTALSQGT